MELTLWWLWTWIVAVAVTLQVAKSDPQTNSLGNGCSNVVATNVSDFINNLNATFSGLRAQLSDDKWFATAQSSISSEPVYGMAQCRDYMSQLDCLACYDAAVSDVRATCSKNVTGARSVFDGCFLRYESYNFYARTSDSWMSCSDRLTSDNGTVFTEEGAILLNDLRLAAPRTRSFFAASNRKFGSTTIYGVAQCARTVSQAGCQGCLTAAYEILLGRCLPKTYGRVVDVACFMRYSNSPFFPDNQTTDIQPLLQPPRNANEKAVIGGAVGGAGLLVIVVTIVMWYKFSTSFKNALIGNILRATELQSPNIYSYKDLKEATNSFSEENKLGQGGSGSVYKATLRNGTVVAVKKLNISHSTAKKDFESEVTLISNANHRNLARLLGCCSEGSELLLVYEYMERGSLNTFLYGEKPEKLTWKQRYDIIFGTAKGIAYLHENYHVKILHRDIKPSNILLDNEFQPKIADFGLAKLLPENQSHVTTKNIAGTRGYTAPEYMNHGHLSEKVDIYSFGIVILEIISGRKWSDVNTDSTTDDLLREAWKLYERGRHESLADKALDSEEYEVEHMKKMVEIGLRCVQSPASRPTISELIMMICELSDGSIGERALRRPLFSYGNIENGLLSEQNPTAGNATVTISDFTGR